MYWTLEFDVLRVFRGEVPDPLVGNGSDVAPGCASTRDVSDLRIGDELFVSADALSDQSELSGAPEPGFTGYWLVWRREGDGWTYLDGAMRPAEAWRVPPAAERATTLSEIVGLVAPGALPDTASATPPANRAPEPVNVLAAFALLATLLAALGRRRVGRPA